MGFLDKVKAGAEQAVQQGQQALQQGQDKLDEVLQDLQEAGARDLDAIRARLFSFEDVPQLPQKAPASTCSKPQVPQKRSTGLIRAS